MGRVDFPFAIRGASLGFSVLLIGILLSTVVSVAKPAVGLALSSVPYVLAFFLAARRTGTATAPALHGAVAATVAYALVLPLILRDPAGRNLTQIAFTMALAISVGALTGWLTSRDQTDISSDQEVSALARAIPGPGVPEAPQSGFGKLLTGRVVYMARDEADGSAPRLVNLIQRVLLGEDPTLTGIDVAAQAGINPAQSQELWRQLGFPHAADTDIAFTAADVEGVRLSMELRQLGLLSPESQAALVRTLARNSARLAQWQTRLLADMGAGIVDDDYVELIAQALSPVEKFQNYIWRRHMASASAALLITEDSAAIDAPLAVCFVDIVGYTSLIKELDETEFVDWIERFESDVTSMVAHRGGQVVKTMGDEALFVIDDPRKAAEIGLALTARGSDEGDAFPAVRVGMAYGNVVHRLGDVFGTTVNVAARLTSIGRPGTVIADQGTHDLLCSDHAPAETRSGDFRFRKLRRRSIKGYSRLDAWALRRAGA